MHRAKLALVALMFAGCTLVVGGDPQIVGDASADDATSTFDTAEDVAQKDESPTIDVAMNTCDAGGCNAAKDACKKACAADATACNAACTEEAGGKTCQDSCKQKQNACNDDCVMTCDQCVKGCGPPCAN